MRINLQGILFHLAHIKSIDSVPPSLPPTEGVNLFTSSDAQYTEIRIFNVS